MVCVFKFLQDIKRLFSYHYCGQSQPNDAQALSAVTNALMGSIPKRVGFPPLGAHGVSGITYLPFHI